MEHQIREEGSVLVVVLNGDVDFEQAPAARKVLLECVGRGGSVLVDLSGVGYIDSSGVASLVEAYQAARKAQTAFALAAVSAGAMRVLELARLNKVFTIHDSLDAGLESLG
ncbi:MAG: STAS domain-containing protein [Alphaproteobacteria bacterium]|nr:STAS domain-containing protein [Alphaproteobacteria bacterium]